MNLLSKYSRHSDYLPVRNEIHLRWYVHFLESRKSRVIPEGALSEVHHIVPLDFLPCDWSGFQKDEKNTIRLTTREHIIAHMILEKVTKAPSMTYAYSMMINTRNAQGEIVRLTIKEAANLRERYISSVKEWYSDYYKNKPTLHEGHKHSEKSKGLMRERAKGRPNPNKGKSGVTDMLMGRLRGFLFLENQIFQLDGLRDSDLKENTEVFQKKLKRNKAKLEKIVFGSIKEKNDILLDLIRFNIG